LIAGVTGVNFEPDKYQARAAGAGETSNKATKLNNKDKRRGIILIVHPKPSVLKKPSDIPPGMSEAGFSSPSL
jgi:hypothetical protein